MADGTRTVGIVGARGYVGAELMRLIDAHPGLRLGFAASRALIGQPVEHPGGEGLAYVDSDVAAVAGLDADAVVLAVPDGAAGAYAEALEGRLLLDLSSDFRFDDGWVYGLSEHNGAALRGATRVSNPGCYATAVQLALRPVMDLVDGTAHAFGVSGYSGAGKTPSERNDPGRLEGAVSPYKLVGHTHEREVSRYLGRPVRFSPSVGAFFRGITLTVQARATEPTSAAALMGRLTEAYAGCGLVGVVDGMPRAQDVVGTARAEVGGVTVSGDGMDFAMVCVLDNLMKGAASQAVQNLNLAFGFGRDLSLTEAGVGAGKGASA